MLICRGHTNQEYILGLHSRKRRKVYLRIKSPCRLWLSSPLGGNGPRGVDFKDSKNEDHVKRSKTINQLSPEYIYIYIYIYIELAQMSNLKLFLIQLLLFFYPCVLLNHLSASVIRSSLLWLTTHQTSNFFKVRSLNLVLKLL